MVVNRVVVVLLVVTVVVVLGFCVVVVTLVLVGDLVVVDFTCSLTFELLIALGLILLKIFFCHQGIVDEALGTLVVVQNKTLAGILLFVVFDGVVVVVVI